MVETLVYILITVSLMYCSYKFGYEKGLREMGTNVIDLCDELIREKEDISSRPGDATGAK